MTGAAPPGPVAEVVPLPPLLDTQAVPAVMQLLGERRGQDLVLDGAGVQRLGGQCLQILLSAQAAWDAEGCTLTLLTPSAEFRSGLALLGIEPGAPLLKQEFPS